MKKLFCLWILTLSLISSSSAASEELILADLSLLKLAQVPVLWKDEELNLGYAKVDFFHQSLLSYWTHSQGRCGGFQRILEPLDQKQAQAQFDFFQGRKEKEKFYMQGPFNPPFFSPKPEIVEAINQLKKDELNKWVQWITSFPSRYHKLSDPNNHVRQLADKLQKILEASGRPGRVEMIDHTSTKQKTLRLILSGSTRPEEIVALGAHFDSIVKYGNELAPGADDDASGSANLLEVLRILLTQAPLERSVEFFWYAGEESGLLGSTEIAKSYKKQNKKVISVLQLDMTLFPGAGLNRLALMKDFSSAWLNQTLKNINQAYVGVEIVDSECGYACSDHAAWYKEGFASAMPFESTFETYNKDIHTANDVISPKLNFDHSLQFSKLALAYVMELGNGELQNPVY